MFLLNTILYDANKVAIIVEEYIPLMSSSHVVWTKMP